MGRREEGTGGPDGQVVGEGQYLRTKELLAACKGGAAELWVSCRSEARKDISDGNIEWKAGLMFVARFLARQAWTCSCSEMIASRG
eukprot:1143209-Pelagomonas_calceolata.AAC.11